MKLLDKLLLSPEPEEPGGIHSYIEGIKTNLFKDMFCFGISEGRRGFHLINPLTDPGALYCGGMGSGKSIAMKFTLITHMLANSENTIYILFDGLKGMSDYKLMFKYTKNVAYAINDMAKIVPVIDMVHAEMMSRKVEFSRVGAANYIEYDKIMKAKDPSHKSISRIVLACEEFHSIPNSEYVKFPFMVDNQGSVAFQLKELMRVGRSYGLTLLAATQRAVSDDFPSSLKAGISQMMAFRVNNINDVSAMNVAHAADIRPGNPGRCAYMDGFIQFPYMEDEVAEFLLNKFYKPFNAKLLKYQVEDYQKAFLGEGNEGVLYVKPYTEILKNYKQFNQVKIAERFLKAFGFKTKDQTIKAYNCNLLAERDGRKYVVLVITDSATMGTAKAASSLKESIVQLKQDSAIVISIDKQVPSAFTSMISSVNGYTIDVEDFYKAAGILDESKNLDDFDQMINSLPIMVKKENPPLVTTSVTTAAPTTSSSGPINLDEANLNPPPKPISNSLSLEDLKKRFS